MNIDRIDPKELSKLINKCFKWNLLQLFQNNPAMGLEAIDNCDWRKVVTYCKHYHLRDNSRNNLLRAEALKAAEFLLNDKRDEAVLTLMNWHISFTFDAWAYEINNLNIVHDLMQLVDTTTPNYKAFIKEYAALCQKYGGTIVTGLDHTEAHFDRPGEKYEYEFDLDGKGSYTLISSSKRP